MTGKLRIYITILLSALYLAETLVVGVTHRHWCGSPPLEVCDRNGLSEHEACDGIHEHTCSSVTEEAGSKSEQDSQPPRAPCHDEDNCPICRHLAQRFLCEQPVSQPFSGELVELVQPVRPVFYAATVRLAHRSRGPPA